MDLRQLQYFLAVYDFGSYGAAGQRLKLTQQAVSAGIAKLESALDTRLFDRDRTGARPTPAAEILLPYARLLFADAERAQRALERFQGDGFGTVRVGVALVPPGGALPRAISRMKRERPAVALVMTGGLITDLRRLLLTGEIDLIIGAPPKRWALDGDLVMERLFETTPRVLCGRQHPLATRRRLALADLVDYPWILPPPKSPFKDILERAFEAKGLVPPTALLQSDAYAVTPSLLELEHYLVFTYPELFDYYIEHDILKVLPVDVSAPISDGVIVTRGGDVLDEPAKFFVALIKQEMTVDRRRSA